MDAVRKSGIDNGVVSPPRPFCNLARELTAVAGQILTISLTFDPTRSPPGRRGSLTAAAMSITVARLADARPGREARAWRDDRTTGPFGVIGDCDIYRPESAVLTRILRHSSCRITSSGAAARISFSSTVDSISRQPPHWPRRSGAAPRPEEARILS